MSGFVYLWFDRKRKRFYLGCHWGSPDDGYVCSSRWMKQAYANRPEDFRRRILRVITTSREELLAEERRWLDMIEDHELGGRYYNLSNRSTWTPRGGLRFRAPRKRGGNHYIQLLVPHAEKELLLEMYDRIRVAKELAALQRANRIRERTATYAIPAANAVPIANGVYSFGA